MPCEVVAETHREPDGWSLMLNIRDLLVYALLAAESALLLLGGVVEEGSMAALARRGTPAKIALRVYLGPEG